jgi:hypothetical protein
VPKGAAKKTDDQTSTSSAQDEALVDKAYNASASVSAKASTGDVKKKDKTSLSREKGSIKTGDATVFSSASKMLKKASLVQDEALEKAGEGSLSAFKLPKGAVKKVGHTSSASSVQDDPSGKEVSVYSSASLASNVSKGVGGNSTQACPLIAMKIDKLSFSKSLVLLVDRADEPRVEDLRDSFATVDFTSSSIGTKRKADF